MFYIGKNIIKFFLILMHINTCVGFNMFINRRNFITNSLLLSGVNKNIYLNESYNSNILKNDGNVIYNNDEKKIITRNNNFNNNIYFTGGLNEETCFELTEILINHKNLAMTNADYPNHINLYIQSPGGSLLPTLALVDEIKNLEIPVHTYIRGYAASAATLLSVVGARRFINKHSVMMIHGLKFGDEQKASDLLTVKDLNYNTDVFLDIIKDIYLDNTNLTEELLEQMFYHDKWINSEDCLKYGLVDEIL